MMMSREKSAEVVSGSPPDKVSPSRRRLLQEVDGLGVGIRGLREQLARVSLVCDDSIECGV